MADTTSDVVLRIQAQDTGFPELEARVTKALTTLAKQFQALGDSQTAAAAHARDFENSLSRVVQSQAQSKIDALQRQIAGMNPRGGVGADRYGPPEIIAPAPRPLPPLQEQVGQSISELSRQYQLVGLNAVEADAKAGTFREGLTKLAQTQAQAKVDKLAADIRNVGESANPVTRVFNELAQEIGKVGNVAVGFAIGNLGAQLALGITERVTQAAEQIDTYGKAVLQVERVTGEKAQGSSALVATFERFGISAEDVAGKLSRFERALTGNESALDLTESGGKRGAQVLADLGVATVDATGKTLPMTQVLLNLADAFTTTDAASKNAAVRTLFGGLGGAGAEQMLLMLNQGRAGLQAFMNDPNKYGLILTDENANDVAAFIASHRQMDLALQGLSVQLGAAFMPAITATAQALTGLTQVVVSDLVPLIKQLPGFLIPATLGVVGFGLAWKALDFATSPVRAVLGSLAGAILSQGGAAATAAAENVALAGAESAAGAAAATAAPEVAGLGAAGTAAIAGIGAIATAAISATAAVAALAAALALPVIAINAEQSAADTNQKILAGLSDDARKAAQAYLDAHMQQVVDAGGGQITQTGEHLVLQEWLEANGIDEASLVGQTGDIVSKIREATDRAGKAVSDALPKVALPTPEIGDLDAGQGISQSAAEAATKVKKQAADAQLKGIQDATAQRKDAFDLGELDNETTAMQLKLTAELATSNVDLLNYKRQIEDIDANSVDYALKRRQLDEQDAVTVAKLAEDRLKANADDLSYQDKLLLAQARAAKMRGEDVDLGALRDRLLNIRKQQIQDEPGLLVAQHDTQLADRAKQGTDIQTSLHDTATERAKLAVQEAMKPLEAAATIAKRAADDAQTLIGLDKQRFDIAEQAHRAELVTAQSAAKAADAAYQAAVAAVDAAKSGFNPQGGVGKKGYGPELSSDTGAPELAPLRITPRASGGPIDASGLYLVGENGPELFMPRSSGTILPRGVGLDGSGGGVNVTVTIQQQNSIRSEDDIDQMSTSITDRVLEVLRSAFRQVSQPARQSLPGAFAAATP